MRSPEEALAAARAQAEERRGSGEVARGQNILEDAREVGVKRLTAWAMIEPEELAVYSTRRFGAPITALKRGLIRLLRQYLVQMAAQQSRFNASVVAQLVALDERIQALEQARAGAGGSDQTEDPGSR